MDKNISISVVAEMLGVSTQTLRRWDDDDFFKSHRSASNDYRYYTEDSIEDFLSENYKYLARICHKWAFDKKAPELPSRFFCPDRSIFKARLSKLETLLSKDELLGNRFSIIISIIAEIGENSFDHNTASWPDIRGIIFAYGSEEREIILADRGQGILNTLKEVKKELSDHESALKVAFTEFISGRFPENRGNGLKHVRKEVEKCNSTSIYFQSGNAYADIEDSLEINKADNFNQGCFVKINY